MLNLSGLEHLYAFVLRQDPEEGFEFRVLEPGKTLRKPIAGKSLPAGAVLKTIAVARECAAASVSRYPGSSSTKLWRVITLQQAQAAARSPLTDDETMTVSVRDASGPVADATVTFSRAPHLACSTRTDASGVASCRLWDNHGGAGHEGHGEGSSSVTVASFSGRIAQDYIDLPTTAVLHK